MKSGITSLQIVVESYFLVPSNSDWDELADYSEGQFRQRVLEYAGHTPLDLLYSCFSSERNI